MLAPVSMSSQTNWLALAAALLLASCPIGCVQRRLTIRSNPSGALVYVDDQQIGYTPVSTSFTFYGTRKIQLVKDGFETITAKQRFDPPWYEIPPLDFVSENFWPREIRDERVLDFQLVPQQLVPTEKLRQRAESLRSSVRQGVVTPLLNPPPVRLPAALPAAPAAGTAAGPRG